MHIRKERKSELCGVMEHNKSYCILEKQLQFGIMHSYANEKYFHFKCQQQRGKTIKDVNSIRKQADENLGQWVEF